MSLLALTGWADATAGARHDRDALLEGGDPAGTTAKLDALRAKVRRSRVLRWSVRGIRPLDRGRLERDRLSSGLGGDTYERLLGMLERAGDQSGHAVFVRPGRLLVAR